MVTSNLGHHHITDVSKQGGKCPGPVAMENITGSFSKISLDGRNDSGISMDASLQVPKPKSLHWVTQRQRVSRGEYYDINENSNFLLIF